MWFAKIAVLKRTMAQCVTITWCASQDDAPPPPEGETVAVIEDEPVPEVKEGKGKAGPLGAKARPCHT